VAVVHAEKTERDPKFAPAASTKEQLKALKPKFDYPVVAEMGTHFQEKKNKKKNVTEPAKYIFTHPGWYYRRYSPTFYEKAVNQEPYPKQPAYYYHPVAVPHCPTYSQWLNPRYIQKLHNKAMKRRYKFAKKNCMKRFWSGRKRYRCFQEYWQEYGNHMAGHPGLLKDIRSRVQADCMQYKDHPALRKLCFKSHINKYGHLLLDERRLLAEAEDQIMEENFNEEDTVEPIDAEIPEETKALLMA
jgi:hypothetical protein